MKTDISRNGWTFLDAGNDSSVYRINHYVAKVYEPDMDFETLKTYYADTDLASWRIQKERKYIEDEVGKFYKGYTIGVTVLEQGRIRQVGSGLIGDRGYDTVLIGIGQRYIDAKDFVDMDSIFYDSIGRNVRDTDRKAEVRNAIQSALNTTKRIVRNETGITFDIAPINVKVLPDVKQKRLELIITDLASWIDGAYI